jgi:hypothetical protein
LGQHGAVTTGFSYSANVMRSSIAPESSGFYNVSATRRFIGLRVARI